jgi:hypothetical protein
MGNKTDFSNNLLDPHMRSLYLSRLLVLTTILMYELLGSTWIAVAQSKKPKLPDVAQQVVPSTIDRLNTPLLPVGLLVNGKTRLESFYVIGQENGSAAVEFENWLLPFDELVGAMGFKITAIDDQLELSSPTQKFKLPASKVVINRRLGRAIEIRSLAQIPGFTVKFDINKYAVDIEIPVPAKNNFGVDIAPIVLDGLPSVQPESKVGVSIIEQRLNTSGIVGSANTGEIQGGLQAAGTIFDAGWYLRIDQPSISNTRNWNVLNGVILRQRSRDDLIIGSQNPFWRFRNGGTGTYWGATSVTRQGFEPPVRFSGGDYVLSERLQARRTGRTISGSTVPGTLVQLVRNDRNILVQEILVDSSGIYRFENIIVSGTLDNAQVGRDYKILLYPRGQSTGNPIVQDIEFTSFSGQIPVGAQAFVVSAGENRLSRPDQFFPSFDAPMGGVLYRRGITESLTLGAGIAYDRLYKGVGELFWQPSAPLEIAMSAAIDRQESDYIGRLSYRPSRDFSLSANTDRLSSNANASWQLGTNFSARSTYESLRGATVGGEYFTTTRTTSSRIGADIDAQGRIRTSGSQRWEDWQANYQSNESAFNAQISYRPTNEDRVERNHEFVLGYQNSGQINNSSALTSLRWRYNAPSLTGDGRSLWQTELGYGVSGFGSGILANASLNFLPGFQIRGSYQGISDNSNQGSYALEFTTTLLTSGGVRGTFDRVEDLRNSGKVVFQPFLDKNQNGRQDAGEEGYWDPLLIRIDDRSLDQYRPQVSDNRGDLNLANGSYRIDIDPAGYPIYYRSRTDALRLEIVTSGVTTVPIPLVPAYTTIGFIKDAATGNAIPGARVEATNLQTKNKVYSITNDAGFYTLEGLEQGEYQLSVSDLASTPSRLLINATSQPTQELNLTITIPTENTPAKTPTDMNPAAPTSSSRIVIPYINVTREM